MQSQIEYRLNELGLSLPDAPAPAANYVPYVCSGKFIFVSGQISNDENGFIKGCLGKNMSIDSGYRAAKFCGLALIAQLKAACSGNLDRVQKVIKLGGFVNSTSEFLDQPKVINGASDLMADVFGEKGSHARTAVGCILPFGVAVEVDGIFEID